MISAASIVLRSFMALAKSSGVSLGCLTMTSLAVHRRYREAGPEEAPHPGPAGGGQVTKAATEDCQTFRIGFVLSSSILRYIREGVSFLVEERI
jgi:hypothetical protein